MINTLLVKTTDKCQQGCKYCYLEKKNTGEIDNITLINLEKLTDYISKCNRGSNLDIHLSGGEISEIATYKYEQLLKSLSKYGKLHINTNASKFSISHIELAKKYHASISLSLDGPEAFHDSRRGKGNWLSVERLAGLLKKYNVSCGFVMVLDDSCEEHFEEIYNFFKINIGINFKQIKMNPAIPSATPEVWARFMIKLADRLFTDNQELWEYTINDISKAILNQGYTRGCSYGSCYSDYLALNWNGDVTLCERFFGIRDYSEYLVGNINKNTPHEIIFGNRRAELIAMMQHRKLRCMDMDCEWYHLCGGGCSHSCISLGVAGIEAKDPYCISRQELFNHIKKLVNPPLQT